MKGKFIKGLNNNIINIKKVALNRKKRNLDLIFSTWEGIKGKTEYGRQRKIRSVNRVKVGFKVS